MSTDDLDSDAPEHPDALPIGTALGEFVVSKVIGAGGFGIVYLAHDAMLDRSVAIKEYLPITIAGRGGDNSIIVRSMLHRETYSHGLQSFLREARLQARFSHPAMLEVYRVWEENSTAYMAMRYYPGDSLRALRHDPAAAQLFTEDSIRQIISPVFDALEELHSQSVLHRDVSPDNILILPSGSPVLLDFGAARTVVAGAEQSLTTVLKPGYAPIEQYADDGTMEQGPWTDVYGLGAVLHYLATGSAPPQAVTRMLGGTLRALQDDPAGRFSAKFVAAVTAALAVRPVDRLQSVAALRDALDWNWQPTIVQSPVAVAVAVAIATEPAPAALPGTAPAVSGTAPAVGATVPAAREAAPKVIATAPAVVESVPSLREPATESTTSVEPAKAVTAPAPNTGAARPSPSAASVAKPTAVTGPIEPINLAPSRPASRGWAVALIALLAMAGVAYFASTRQIAPALQESTPTVTVPSSAPTAVPDAPPIATQKSPVAAPESVTPPTPANPASPKGETVVTDPAVKPSTASAKSPSARTSATAKPSEKRAVDSAERSTPAPGKPRNPDPARAATDVCERLFAKLSLGNAQLTASEQQQLPGCR